MNRVLRLAIIFAVIEIVFSTASAYVPAYLPRLAGIVSWGDAAIYVAFGLLLTWGNVPNLPVLIVTVAAVAIIDCTVGGTAGYFIRPPRPSTVPYSFLVGMNVMVYPVKSVLWALLGGALAWPFRRIDNPASSV